MDCDDVIERAGNDVRGACWVLNDIQLQGILRAAAPILMEYGARLMREAAANGLEAYAKAYTEQKARAKADKDQKAARDFESMAMTCAFRSTEIRALDPATIVREAVK